MTSDPLFDAVMSDPTNLDARSVFSDFLSDRGDPAGDYLRLEIELSKLKWNSPKAKIKRSELIKAKESVEVKWLRRFQQPDLLLANPTRYSAIWLTSGICDEVEIEGTYGRIEYSKIANIENEEFNGTYDWLEDDGSEEHEEYGTHIHYCAPDFETFATATGWRTVSGTITIGTKGQVGKRANYPMSRRLI